MALLQRRLPFGAETGVAHPPLIDASIPLSRKEKGRDEPGLRAR
jgi:hypothetical protein